MITEFKNLIEFLSFFKDEKVCVEYFEKIRFKDGGYCPHCGFNRINRFSDGKRYRCAKCKKDFTIKTKTIFGESKISIQKWFIAIYLLTTSKNGISSIELSKHVGVTQKTAWSMDHRIREAMKQNNGQLFGKIEVDETYVGGAEKNKHFNKRVKHSQGRSTAAKTPVMGFLQRDGEMKASVIPDVKMRTLEKNIVDNVKFGSHLYTDNFLSYSRIGKIYPHEVVKHGKHEYVRIGDIHSNGAESFWALLKRGYTGTYHSMTKKHLQRYVNEFVYRFNVRKWKMDDVFADVVMRVSVNDTMKYNVLTK